MASNVATTRSKSARGKSRRPKWLRAFWISLGVVAVVAFGVAAMSGRFTSNKTPSTVSFAITSPASDATVTSPVKLSVLVKGATLGDPTDGLDHLHVAVDGGETQAIYDDTDRMMRLEPGRHVLVVDLAGPDHQGLMPVKTVSFTVR